MRHGMSPEDADKPRQGYQQFRASSARSQAPDLEIESPTGDIETLRTPGVARDQEYIE